ncbi:hypothetical protein HY384_00625 [Candidatus Daviesbacteria bacterium]|nr:hypothetical protein [Candidatus Daviesbacteria bacterium]
MSSERINPANVFIKLPDGSISNVFEVMDREKTRGEQVINTTLLKPGDLIAMQYTREDQSRAGFLFKIAETLLLNAGINVGAPSQIIAGRFHGEGLPVEVTSEYFRFAGSGWGGNFREWGVLVSGRIPKFYSDEGGEFLSPAINRFGVYRPDGSGEIRPVTLEGLSVEAKKISLVHETRVACVKTLMERLHFDADLEDCSQSGVRLAYEDERYLANYLRGMALGNRVVIYDKQTSWWMEYGYFNFEGILKVSFADLTGLDLQKVFIGGDITGESSVIHARVPITTFNTSSNLGINAINYRPGDEDLGEIGIADYDNSKYRFRGKPAPNIQLYPDGKVVLESRGFFVPIETSHPGALQLIREAVTVNTLPDGSVQYSFNGKNINAIDPDAQLDIIIRVVGQTGDTGQSRKGVGASLKSLLESVVHKVVYRKN